MSSSVVFFVWWDALLDKWVFVFIGVCEPCCAGLVMPTRTSISISRSVLSPITPMLFYSTNQVNYWLAHILASASTCNRVHHFKLKCTAKEGMQIGATDVFTVVGLWSSRPRLLLYLSPHFIAAHEHYGSLQKLLASFFSHFVLVLLMDVWRRLGWPLRCSLIFLGGGYFV